MALNLVVPNNSRQRDVATLLWLSDKDNRRCSATHSNMSRFAVMEIHTSVWSPSYLAIAHTSLIRLTFPVARVLETSIFLHALTLR